MARKLGNTKGTPLQENEFDSAKLLLEATGNNISKVARLMERSIFTVSFIAKSESFADYKTAITKYTANKQKGTKPETPAPQPLAEKVVDLLEAQRLGRIESLLDEIQRDVRLHLVNIETYLDQIASKRKGMF